MIGKKSPRITEERASFNVTLPRDLFDALEKERGLVPRSRYVNALFAKWLGEGCR